MAKQPAAVPNLTGGSGVEVRRKVNTVFLTECPNCNQDLDVTGVEFGTHIQCPHCNNVTYRPAYNPPWWVKIINKGWKAILTALVTFGLGFLSSYFATSYYEQEQSDNNAATMEQTTDLKKDSIETIKNTENGN